MAKRRRNPLEARPSEWTIDTLKEYVDALRADDKAALAAALAASETAIQIGEVNNQRWREASNEWRGALDDRERASAAALEKFATRESVDQTVRSVRVEIDELKEWRSRSEGSSSGAAANRSTSFATRGQLLAAVGVSTGIAGFLVAVLTR